MLLPPSRASSFRSVSWYLLTRQALCCLCSICCSMFRYLASVPSKWQRIEIFSLFFFFSRSAMERRKTAKRVKLKKENEGTFDKRRERERDRVKKCEKQSEEMSGMPIAIESVGTRSAIMSTNRANWMKWNTYISFDYLRIVHSWNMVDERWKIIHANQFPVDVLNCVQHVPARVIFTAGTSRLDGVSIIP